MKLDALLYQQFDADFDRAVPAEAFGGWRRVPVDVSLAHTALVVMHAWDCGSPGEFPGWERAVEYIPRARKILADVMPGLLATVRASAMPVFHVAGGGGYHREIAQYLATVRLAGKSPDAGAVASPDESWHALQKLRAEASFPGADNQADVAAGLARRDFAAAARPLGNEPVVEDGHQLAVVCRDRGVNHLIYTGFAINWCLLMSPGGMVDMARRGAICSTIREAVTAVENRETARAGREKAQALWRVSVEFGFVFELDVFLAALACAKLPEPLD